MGEGSQTGGAHHCTLVPGQTSEQLHRGNHIQLTQAGSTPASMPQGGRVKPFTGGGDGGMTELLSHCCGSVRRGAGRPARAHNPGRPGAVGAAVAAVGGRRRRLRRRPRGLGQLLLPAGGGSDAAPAKVVQPRRPPTLTRSASEGLCLGTSGSRPFLLLRYIRWEVAPYAGPARLRIC